jgi:hypothetical protein
MNESKRLEWLIECFIHVVGRVVLKIDDVQQVVGGAKQIEAYNLCDGSLTLSVVAKKSGLDQGNLSRSVDRWVKSGVMFRFSEGKEVRLLHIYPIPARDPRARGKKSRR